MAKKYYDKVKLYYNEDSSNFEERYWENITLQRIRNSFRNYTNKYTFETILEIGFGPGLDLIYFSEKYSDKKIFGIDISDGMHNWAETQINKKKLENINLKVGSVEDIKDLFRDQVFDHIYVYFGALNTVDNIDTIQACLKEILSPKGIMTLTFVNKWYLAAILLPAVKLKFKIATQRLNKIWGGYSPVKYLESRCYSYKDIKKAFNKFEVVEKRGFSILYPAWYDNRFTIKYPKITNFFWKVDLLLQKTPFWNLGEYTLYIFKNKS